MAHLHTNESARSRAVAVLSSFRPGPELVQYCRTLNGQVATVIVVDDGSGSASQQVLADLETSGVTVLLQPENLGIGAAMNRGFAKAKELNAEFVVTFDQDSDVPVGFVAALVNTYDRAVAAGLRPAIIAPEFYSQTRQSRAAEQGEFMPAYSPIQSGALLPMRVVQELGPQRADFFIDLVDSEYYFRAVRAGFDALCVPGLTLPHGFGHRLYVHAFGKRLTKRSGRPRMVAVSSPFRYYYRARNRVVMNAEYAADPAFRQQILADTKNDVLLDFCVALYSARAKWSLLRLLWAGRRDGKRGSLGKMSPQLTEIAQRISWKHPVGE